MLVVVAGLSLLVGRYPSPGFIRPSTVAHDPVAKRVLLYLRLPRIVAAILLGSSLAAAGSTFQMIFSNPLVEPGFLGVSQGAAFGASLAIVVFSGGSLMVQANALFFALLGLGASYTVAKIFRYGGWILRLVLSGIAISAFFSAGIGLLKLAADPLSELPEITFWMLGGLWSVSWADVLAVLPAVLFGLTIQILFRWRLNILSTEDRVAHSLGAAPGRERILLLFSATLSTAAVISISGIIGWAGLVIPHASRKIFGTESHKSLPASLALGAIYLLICDVFSRTLLTAEIPLGILTSLAGTIAFLILMTRKTGGNRG